jgi:hypothetical protein
MYSRVRASGLAKGWPYQPSTTWGPDSPSPSTMRPSDRWSSVMACMAVEVGVRADICVTAVPSRMRDVRDPHHASGPNTSDPHDSAVNTMS